MLKTSVAEILTAVGGELLCGSAHGRAVLQNIIPQQDCPVIRLMFHDLTPIQICRSSAALYTICGNFAAICQHAKK